MKKDLSKKILSREALPRIIQEIKQQGKTLVTTNGSFDLLHIGHVTMLREAKSLGDVLIVGLNSDAGVKRYKGKTRPICPQEHRAKMLAALECTDYITIFDELTPIPLLEIIQPDIHVNSPEHGYDCVEREVVERYGGRMYLAQLIESMSTSQLIPQICKAAFHQSSRAIFLNASDLSQETAEDLLDILTQMHSLEFYLFLFNPSDEPGVRQKQHFFQHKGLPLLPVEHPLNDLRQLDTLVEQYDLSFAKSFIISSQQQDIRIGREINCKTVLLEKTRSETENEEAIASSLGPNYTVETLAQAVSLLESALS